MSRLLLLTGPPGVGKTTVIRRVAATLDDRRPGGFYTEEMRGSGRRLGFRLVTFDGRDAVLAHVHHRGPYRVGRYGVDVSVLDGLAASALGPPATTTGLYLIDEIGKMECLSDRFVAAVRRLIDSSVIVIATVAERGEGLIAEVKRRPAVEMWQVTRDARDALPAEVMAWLDTRK